jgi:hypothetical protein
MATNKRETERDFILHQSPYQNSVIKFTLISCTTNTLRASTISESYIFTLYVF